MTPSPLIWLLFGWALALAGHAEQNIPENSTPARLSISNSPTQTQEPDPFTIPLPAHAIPKEAKTQSSFSVESSRKSPAQRPPKEEGRATYLLPEKRKKESILPEAANVNLPKDTELTALDTGEKILLPAGTYRQIMKFPINSPMLSEETRARELKSPTIATEKPKSRYAEPPSDPIWVRYESLDKIKIGEVERRGGLDIPSHGPKDLGPRVWYAKSETADIASSAFYFVFGGLGYGIANLAGWSAGNIREVPNDFEYRLIRK